MIGRIDCEISCCNHSSYPKWEIYSKKAARKTLIVVITKKNYMSLRSPINLNLYKLTILPNVIYVPNCWSATNATTLKLVENVQTRSLNGLLTAQNMSGTSKKGRLLPLSLYLQVQDLLFVAKIIPWEL